MPPSSSIHPKLSAALKKVKRQMSKLQAIEGSDQAGRDEVEREDVAPGVFLRLITLVKQLLLSEMSIVIKAKLGIGSNQFTVPCLCQRIHLYISEHCVHSCCIL